MLHRSSARILSQCYYWQVLIYASCNAVTKSKSPAGYMLLRVICKYLECDMYMGFAVYTVVTLDALDSCILEFADLLEVCFICNP